MRFPDSLFLVSIGFLFLLLLVSCESETDNTLNDTVINIINETESINITQSINLTEIKQDCVNMTYCNLPDECRHRLTLECNDGIIEIPVETCELAKVCYPLAEIYNEILNITSINETCILEYVCNWDHNKIMAVSSCDNFYRCDQPRECEEKVFCKS